MNGAIAVAHYCEGGGHATRMLAVADGIADAGYETVLAGGGPGRAFVEENGYAEFAPRAVDFIRGYQRGNLRVVLERCFPNLVDRVTEYVSWLETHTPPLLVADDLSAAIAATVRSIPYYYVTHDPAGFYTNRVERAAAWLRNRFAALTAERFLLPKVWEGEPTIPKAVEIPPIAPGGGEAVEEPVGLLVVPSAFSVDEERLIGAIEATGRPVTAVGGDEWEVVASLQPYIDAADAVVCSGYSTVMEAAVAGTPCIVLPQTSEQRGVARAISPLRGFYPAETVPEVVDAIERAEPPREYENGTDRVVEAALGGLAR